MEAAVVGADVHVADEVLQDLTEGQGDDGQIVAPQTQDGDTDEEAHDASHGAAADHGDGQAQNVRFHTASQQTADDNAGEGADAHETGMAQAQLTADADQQVQRNGQHDVAAGGDQIAGDGAAQHAQRRQGLHDGKCHDDEQVGHGIGAGIFVFQNILHNTHLTPFPGPACPADRRA